MKVDNIMVVGAGPAGMMAALRAGEVTDAVVLFEKNASPARKLGLTGKGRCNLTNACSVDEFLAAFGKNGLFLRNALKKFSPRDLMRFFEKRGLMLKEERQGRVFPVSDSSRSVMDVLERAVKEAGVDVHLSSPVARVWVENRKVQGVCLASGQKFFGRKVILATGGASYQQTGSTGDGFKMAQGLGHKIEELKPALVPLETQEDFVRLLLGLTLKNIRIVFAADSKRIESDVGELVFTHHGVSGPLVLDLSHRVVELLARDKKITMFIDLKPGLSEAQIHSRLMKDFKENGALGIKNYLKTLLPQRFAGVFLDVLKLEGSKKCHQITAAERNRLVGALKKFPLTIQKTRPLSEAMVTAGGVSLKEVDPATMASKRVEGLYFAGEVLDLAARSGGFNLQAAFSTGYAAGESAALSLI